MKPARLCLSICSALVLIAPLAQAQDALIPKQLAGPPSEFSAMQAPNPADAAIISKSALIPVQFGESKSGQKSWQGALPIENGSLRFLVFSGAQGGWQVDMATPSGNLEKSAKSLARETRRADFGIEDANYPADYYSLDGLQNGSWTLKIRGDSSASGGYVLLEGDSSTELASYQTHRRQLVGERIGLAAQLTHSEVDDSTSLGKAAGRVDSAALRVTAPDGNISSYAMFDDGRHGDGAAHDGLYGGDFLAARSGQYLAQVIVNAHNRNGQALVRTAEHVIPVVEASLKFPAAKSSLTASARFDAASRLAIGIPVSSVGKSSQHYRAYAEVWGSNARGQSVPVAWVSGMVTPQADGLQLGLDPRWIARAGAVGSFELRNLRVEDADHFVTVIDADRIAMNAPDLSGKALRDDGATDELMTMGPRPVETALEKDLGKGIGTRLLLVHGYCSGGVWPAAQFSNASTFLDVNQNRTHDQFAQLIKSFGNTWNSYGIVAHSQGGAAALHLYTYYWSGLDNATGSRLIQSVGTPYKGTNLAGILATLGSWFGVGCGTNDNLSYSGASAWLAGIPTSSRAKVNYYTASFKLTNWWTNDYCNFATDLVLSDPEDGTTEQVNGQLSGGVNRGHTTGQCHTSGMRDPAEYLDASRNSIMNSNAAR